MWIKKRLKQLGELVKKCKKFILTVIVIVVFAGVLLLPFILNALYQIDSSISFFDIGSDGSHGGYTPGELLEYYGVVISAVVTAILAVLTIIQTRRANEKSDEVDRLKLEIMNKELSLAKKQYDCLLKTNDDNERKKNPIPGFEIKINGYSGSYAKITLTIQNTSSLIVSALTGISLDILNNKGEIMKYEDGSEMPKAKRFSFDKRNLDKLGITRIQIDTPNMIKESNVFDYNKKIIFPRNVTMVFNFSCEDEMSNKYYYEARLTIPNTEKMCEEAWDCKRVG